MISHEYVQLTDKKWLCEGKARPTRLFHSVALTVPSEKSQSAMPYRHRSLHTKIRVHILRLNDKRRNSCDSKSLRLHSASDITKIINKGSEGHNFFCFVTALCFTTCSAMGTGVKRPACWDLCVLMSRRCHLLFQWATGGQFTLRDEVFS